ncbi:pilus assembly protein Flp/PilA [Acetoanaerobium pronyense]|uniref:Pilus assembly protein Flp/PilA n=1 Tax=Acetoanaerobium pronyense TaxID=1482736 RepID=A0ABS4KKI6_9FIRM|nr:Flp family type IVb pilin [Acetoanaerobium pronyense]MBP2028304.1 pilus assembly protein Flp/PilA [Acetoanaerobium pronyense]
MLDYMKALLYPFIERFVKDEEGQGLVEYALIIALIAIVLVGALQLVEGGIDGVFTKISTALGGAGE